MYKIMLADDEGIVIDSVKFIIEKEFGDQCIVEFAKTGRSKTGRDKDRTENSSKTGIG